MWQALNTFGLVILGLIAIYNSRQIKDVHIAINGRLSQLLELTKTSSKAEGVKEQKEEDKK